MFSKTKNKKKTKTEKKTSRLSRMPPTPRNEQAQKYNQQLKNCYKVPEVPDGYLSSWAQYTLQVEDRAKVINKYTEEGIPTMIYYSKNLHQQSAFDYLGYSEGDFPNAEKLSQSVLSLPMHGYMK